MPPPVLYEQEELAFREAAFTWFRAQQSTEPIFTRVNLSQLSCGGTTHRLFGPISGFAGWQNKNSVALVKVPPSLFEYGLERPCQIEHFSRGSMIRLLENCQYLRASHCFDNQSFPDILVKFVSKPNRCCQRRNWLNSWL